MAEALIANPALCTSISQRKCLQPTKIAACGSGFGEVRLTRKTFAERKCSVVAKSKFEQFQKPAVASEEGASAASTAELEEDSELPNDLNDTIGQASEATSRFLLSSGTRAIVEILVPDLEVLGEEGAQQLLWESSKLFIENVEKQLNGMRIKAIFPDAGVAAMLKHNWKNITFEIASLTDRRPVSDSDDVVLLIAPDFQMLSQVQSIGQSLAGEEGELRPLVMWNPRLISGDVGVGLNVRRLRENFLNSFVTVYHLRPLAAGAIYRSYPSRWKMFLEDPERTGRYTLHREQLERPDLDDMEDMMLAESGSGEEAAQGPSFLAKTAGMLSSLSRFMKALSN